MALIPFAYRVQVEAYDPPRKLWRIPSVRPGICPGCECPIDTRVVQFSGHDWHPDCFRCSLCREPFADSCIPVDDLILHPACYQECFDPRCSRCTRPIAQGTGAAMRARPSHHSCLTCISCGDPSVALAKVLLIHNFPFCQRCFYAACEFLPRCLGCQKPVLPDDASHSFFFNGRRHSVHAGRCLQCSICSAEVEAHGQCEYGGRLLCRDCHARGCDRLCGRCGEPVFKDAVTFGGVWWHADHFSCGTCRRQLRPADAEKICGDLMCKRCVSVYRTQCRKCGQPVAEGAVVACGARWHPGCLECQFCRRVVDFRRVTNVRNKPCCTYCQAQMIAEGRMDRRGRLMRGVIDGTQEDREHTPPPRRRGRHEA